MSNIQKIARQALITFTSRDHTAFATNFEKLKCLAISIKPSDINLELPIKELSTTTRRFTAPVLYVSIAESKYFTLGVFVLKNGVSIPLHDHPGMHGICKVLYGAVKVKSYDVLPRQYDDGNDCATPNASIGRKQIKCKYSGERIFDSESESCMLSPGHGNFHSIQSINGQAAFLDILAPPYVTGERDCSYYKECSFSNNKPLSSENESIRWLVEIPQPMDFYCDSLPYKGPPIELEE